MNTTEQQPNLGTATPPAQNSKSTALARRSLDTIALNSGWQPEDVAKGNVLITDRYFRQISEYHLIALEMITVAVPKKVSGKNYYENSTEDLYKEQNGKYAANKHLLEKIAMTAGVRWDVNRCGILHRDSESVVYRAVGGIRGLNGEWNWIEKIKEWSLDVELIEIEERAADMTVWDNSPGAERGSKKPATDAEKASYIRKETARAKKHRMAMAEAKAKNRVIRTLLGLPSSADVAWWSKPLFIPRIDLHLDANDPDVKTRLLDEAFGARTALGFQPATDAEESSHAPIDTWDEAEDVEIEEEHVIEVSIEDVEEPVEPAGVDQDTGQVADPIAEAAAELESRAQEPTEDEQTALDLLRAEWIQARDTTIPFGDTFKGQTLHQVWHAGTGGRDFVRTCQKLPGGQFDYIRKASTIYVQGIERGEKEVKTDA